MKTVSQLLRLVISGLLSVLFAPLGLSQTSTQTKNPRLVNLATRAQIAGLTGQQANPIVGFVVSGNPGTQIQLLLRGVGPSLQALGVPNTPNAMMLKLYNAKPQELWTNTRWDQIAFDGQQITQTSARIGAFALQPKSGDAAMLYYLFPEPYTMELSSVDGSGGVGIVEAYEATPSSCRLINLSTRAAVLGLAGNASNPIAGFVIAGTPEQRLKVLIRGVGPALATFGVKASLPAATIVLLKGSDYVAANTGWDQIQSEATEISQASAKVGAFALPPRSFDAAMIMSLVPGAYTVQFSSTTGSPGIGLIEVYEVP